MAARADLLTRAVRDFPVVVEFRAAHRCGGGVHSYLGDGRVVCWAVPPAGPADLHGPEGSADARELVGWAIDAELVSQRVPSNLSARWDAHAAGDASDPERFWRLWCATEVLAKLAHVPVVVLLSSGPVTVSPAWRDLVEVHWVARRLPGVVVVHGLAWATTTPDLT